MRTNAPQSGIPNIYYRKDNQSFNIRIMEDGNHQYYGQFKSLLEASKALTTILEYKELMKNVKTTTKKTTERFSSEETGVSIVNSF